MFYEEITKIISFGITSAIAIMIGSVFFKAVKGGVKSPIFKGEKFIKKIEAFIFFIISIFVVGWASIHIQANMQKFMLENSANLFIGLLAPLIILWFLFNWLFY